MTTWLEDLNRQVPFEIALPALRAFLILAGAHVISRLLVRWVKRRHFDPQVQLVLERGLGLSFFVLAATWALHELGFGLGPLVGAAGLLSVAIGLAARTAVSNLISGIFLIGERPFLVGDIIEVDQHLGEVLSIDSMAVRLRTFDNLVVRIPNETLLKTSLVNLTAFPIRRHDLRVAVSYRADLKRVRAVMLEAAAHTPGVLVEPEPVVVVEKFASEGVLIRFSTWCPREEYVPVGSRSHEAVKRAFDDEGIEFAMPRVVLDQGAVRSDRASGAIKVASSA